MTDTNSQGADSSSTQQSAHSPKPKPVESEHPPRHDRVFERILRRAWRHTHFRFPRLIPSPYHHEREYLRLRDAEDNLASRVPVDERLGQMALWGVEIFGPAEIDALHLALGRLGWNDDRLFGFNINPGAWISEQRTYGTEGSLNLGVIERPGKSRFLPRGRPAPLPDAVDYALGYVYQLAPSVTAVILCFVLTESASGAYHAELARDQRTVHEPIESGYRSYNVEHAKRCAVNLVRTQSRALVVDWFAKYLPGLFSSTPEGNRLPTAELIATASQPLFSKRAGLQPDWIHLVAPLGHREVWSLKGCDGLELCWPDSEGDLRYHAIANLRTSLLTADHLKHRGEHGHDTYALFVNDHIDGILVNFAATATLRETIRLLRLTPSSLSDGTTSRRNTVKCLEQIQLFFDRSVGIPAITSELVAKSEKVHSYKWSCAAFHSKPWRNEDQPVEISEALRSRTHFLASRAASLEKETREHLEQLSGILSTRENIRTQTRMELVAIGAAILSLASLVVAVMSVDRFAAYANEQVEKLYKQK